MFNRTKTASRSSSGNSAHHVIAQSLGWEESRIHLLEKSESRAWWIARAAILGAFFVWYAWKVLRMSETDRAMKPAKALFGYSILYLFAIFALYLADSLFLGAYTL